MTRKSVVGELEVEDVAPDSPAQKAGIGKGEVIIAVNDEKVRSQPEFSEIIRSRPAGSIVALKVRGTMGERRVTLKLGTQPEEP